MTRCNYFIVMLLCLCALTGTALGMSNPHHTGTHPPTQQPPQHDHGKVEIGHPAPVFSLDAVVNQELKKVSLADFRGKWVVLFFYPGDFTFICPTEIKGFNASLEQFRTINTEIIGVSVDSKYSHLAWIKSGALGKLDYPLLSDFSKQVSRVYGVLDEDASHARRGLFIVDPKGIVQHIVIHSDKVGRSVDETLRVLKALQTQEMCPLNWKPGEKSLGK